MTKVSPLQFRHALGQYATGVTIVTASGRDGQDIGITANSFASVSLEPPLVLWSIDKASPLYEDFAAASHYAVHVLQDNHQVLAHRFSDDDIDKFDGMPVQRGTGNLPLLDHYTALLQCAVAERHEAGDHLILIGRVLDVQLEAAEPLVFFSGGYRRLEN